MWQEASWSSCFSSRVSLVAIDGLMICVALLGCALVLVHLSANSVMVLKFAFAVVEFGASGVVCPLPANVLLSKDVY
jgi:hypothetical protein